MSDPTVEPRPVRTAVSATTTLSVVVAVIAVILGFFILRDLDGSGGGSTTGPVSTEPSDTTPVIVTTTTTIPQETTTTLLTTGFEVIVANASGVGGSAGKLTDQLKGRGYFLSEPTNADSSVGTLAATVIYYLPGFEAGAESVSTTLGGKEILPIPEVVPTQDASMGSASVLVMLGTDQADKKLPKRK